MNGSGSLEGVSPTLAYYSGSAATGSPLSGAPSTAGTYTVVANFAGSIDYASGSTNSTFTIAQASPSITLSDGGGTFRGSAFPATATVAGVVSGIDSMPASSLEGITPSLSYYAGSAATGSPLSGAPTTVGEYTVVANFAGSSDYVAGTSNLTFAIAPATPSVTVFDAGGVATGSTNFPATAQVNGASSLEGVTPTLAYYAGNATTGSPLSGAPSAVGTYTVVASFGGSTDFTSAGFLGIDVLHRLPHGTGRECRSVAGARKHGHDHQQPARSHQCRPHGRPINVHRGYGAPSWHVEQERRTLGRRFDFHAGGHRRRPDHLYAKRAANSADIFTFTVSDGALSAIGATTFAITVDQKPVLAVNAGLLLVQGSTAAITSSQLKVTDADSTDAQLTFTLSTAPFQGTLSRSGTALSTGSTFTQADIDNGLITYTQNGATNSADRFTFTVSDGAGGLIGQRYSRSGSIRSRCWPSIRAYFLCRGARPRSAQPT